MLQTKKKTEALLQVNRSTLASQRRKENKETVFLEQVYEKFSFIKLTLFSFVEHMNRFFSQECERLFK